MPSVILRIFLALLPNLLAFMSHVQGMTSLSQIDFGVMRKYFIFQASPYLPCLFSCCLTTPFLTVNIVAAETNMVMHQ